jgi:hypothetical protein
MNPMNAIGHDLKVAAVDVAKGIEYPISFLVKAESVIASAIKDQPEVKTAVISLIAQAESVIGDVATASAAKGIDLASDAKALADAETFFNYFKSTFIPLVEQVYTEVAADVQ